MWRYAECRVIDVDEMRDTPGVHNRICGGDEGKRWNKNLIAWQDSGCMQGDLYGYGTIDYSDRVGRPASLG